MEFTDISFDLLIFSTILIVFLLYYVIKKKTTVQLKKSFSYVLICVFIICIGVIFQKLFSCPKSVLNIFDKSKASMKDESTIQVDLTSTDNFEKKVETNKSYADASFEKTEKKENVYVDDSSKEINAALDDLFKF